MILERLAKSAENNHGLTLSPVHVREIVTIMQAMQSEVHSQQMRADGVTRIASCALNQIGGKLDIVPSMYEEAEKYIVYAQWEDDESEEGIIHVELQQEQEAGAVAVPEVQPDSEAAGDSDGSAVPVLDDQGHQRETAEREDDTDGEDD